MSHEHSLIRLRIFSSKLLCVLCAFLFVLTSCSVPEAKSPKKEASLDSEPAPIQPRSASYKEQVPTAPWELWSRSSFDNKDLEQAERYVNRGKLSEAVALYRKVYESTDEPYIKEEVFVRRAGTLLKLGESKATLNEITVYAQKNGKSIKDLGPRLSFVVAYAYQHQKNVDQTLAWLATVFDQVGGRGELAQKSRSHATRVIRSLSPDYLRELETRWISHRFIGPLLSSEIVRRARGGTRGLLNEVDWFSEYTYHPRKDPNISEEDELALGRRDILLESDVTVFGALLPLSGRFAKHGERVLQGIKLAIEELDLSGERVRLIVADTEGDAELAEEHYKRLVEKNAAFVFGPLLVRTTQRVADRTRVDKVPILSFTKKDGIPDMGRNVFRLGATSRDQMYELVEYATKDRKFETFSVMYPKSNVGLDYARKFGMVVSRGDALVVHQAEFDASDEESIKNAITYVESVPPEAIFIADNLEHAFPLIQRLKDEDSVLKDAILLGPAAWDDLVAIKGYGKLLRGSAFVSPFYSHSAHPKVGAFVRSFNERYKSDPGLLSAQSYDAAKLVGKYLTDALLDQSRIYEIIRTSPAYEGVTGTLKVSQNGEIYRRMSVVELREGKPVEVVSRGRRVNYAKPK